MNAYRKVDAWRRHQTETAPMRLGYGTIGREIRERTTGHEPTRDEPDAVAIGDELWSILNRLPREQAGVLERVYLLNGSIEAEGRMRVHRAREAARRA